MRNKVIVDFQWLVDSSFAFPQDKQFACTGYRACDSPEQMLSIIVILSEKQNIPKASEAELHALVDEMRYKLPKRGEKFFITSGLNVVAECIGR